ncbi:hypothetical protein TEA_018521 [Camellia sinensis var. sinensis]|uniref:Uncharacterized protein n=1 Tax=Camellia sinensis var. sinensis TaxID=542762 RepID=A0A4S4EQ07_CAMSN|nr:hypothetical protein TEA_018521 [Camellia sinensis var. sinensis]
MGSGSTPLLVNNNHEEEDRKPVRAVVREFGNESKRLWKIAGPAIFTSICQYSLGALTQTFAGQLSELDLAAVSVENSVIAGLAFGVMKDTDNLKGGLDYTCMPLVAITKRWENSTSGLAKRISDPVIDLTDPSMDVEFEDLVAARARHSSRTTKITTPPYVKKKRKLQKDLTVKRPKTQGGNKTMSYEVPNDQFRPQMLLPNHCYVSKSDSLMEVPQLGFQLNKGFTLPRNIAFLQPLDDTSLICTGVVNTLRAFGASKVVADMEKRLKLMSDQNLKLTTKKEVAESAAHLAKIQLEESQESMASTLTANEILKKEKNEKLDKYRKDVNEKYLQQIYKLQDDLFIDGWKAALAKAGVTPDSSQYSDPILPWKKDSSPTEEAEEKGSEKDPKKEVETILDASA